MQTKTPAWSGIFIATMLLISTRASDAKSVIEHFPPTGLYMVDSESAVSHLQNGTGVKSSEDGASGNIVGRTYSQENAGSDRQYKGEGQMSRCVKPAPTPAESTIAAAPLLANCHDQSHTVTGDALVMHATCKSGAITAKIRKINLTTWEYEYTVSMTQPAGGPDVSSMRPMLENMAKNAPNLADREKAVKQLSAMPQLQKKMTQQQLAVMDMYAKAEREAKSPEEAGRIRSALENYGGKKPTMEITRKERWTRISSSCPSATPAR
ncbi:hypothetical protein [Actimicrobium antarcticum]|uniref:DUF922 domain-containing protein n=1 Tax=Actimicrobium antarcticum TaxID=1051899 RepID=A0ABP7TJ97_9BURK